MEVSAHGNPVVLERIVASAVRRRRTTGAARRVHAARVSQWQARSGPGGSRGGSDRRSNAGAGAPGVRSARGHVDAEPSRRSASACSTLIVRLEASLDFPDEGYHFVAAERSARRSSARVREEIGALLESARRGTGHSRGPTRRARGRAERGQVEPVQCARRRRSRHRHAGARDDARSGDGAMRHRGLADDAGRYGGPARGAPRSSSSEGISRTRGAASVAASLMLVVMASRPLAEGRRAL